MTQTSREYVSCADTAKLCRAALKSAFAGVKFSVRSHTYAGGASIDIGWIDGPTSDEVDAVVSPYQGATFDGMIDLKSYVTAIVPDPVLGAREVHYGADFIFANREISAAFAAEVAELAKPIHDYAANLGYCHGRAGGCHGQDIGADGWYVELAKMTHSQTVGCSPLCAGRLAGQYVSA